MLMTEGDRIRILFIVVSIEKVVFISTQISKERGHCCEYHRVYNISQDFDYEIMI